MRENGHRGMRQKVVRALRALDAFPLENLLSRGTPDICYADGLIECKVADRPRRAGTPVRVPDFTREQRTTLLRRSRVTCNVRVLLLLGRDWILLPGGWAAENLGYVVEEELWRSAEAGWRGALDEEELRCCLRENDSFSRGTGPAPPSGKRPSTSGSRATVTRRWSPPPSEPARPSS